MYVSLLLACAIVGVAQSVRPKWKDLDSYKFERFLVDFDLNFPESEMTHRRKVFEQELERVKNHNSKDFSWKQGVNKFSALTVEEKQAYFGYSKNMGSAHRKFLKGSKQQYLNISTTVSFPSSVDWRKKGFVIPRYILFSLLTPIIMFYHRNRHGCERSRPLRKLLVGELYLYDFCLIDLLIDHHC